MTFGILVKGGQSDSMCIDLPVLLFASLVKGVGFRVLGLGPRIFEFRV